MKKKIVFFIFLMVGHVGCDPSNDPYRTLEKNTNVLSLFKSLDSGTHIEIGMYNNGISHYAAFERQKDTTIRRKSHPDKLFEIGSITKVLTAYIAHAVVQEHPTIDLNTRLKDLELSFPIHPKNETKIIHLINHTANLSKMPANYVIGMIKHPKNPYLIYNKKRIVEYYKKKKSKSSLGKSFKYSNFGYGVLGLVLADLSGMSHPTLFSQKIKEELGLTNTQMGIVPGDYSKLFLKPGEQADCLWQLNQMESMAGAYSNINDMLRFTEIILHKNKLPVSVQRNLKALEKETIVIDNQERFGQGWRIVTTEDQEDILYHEGGSRGYKSFIAIDKMSNKSIILLSKNCGMNKNNHVLKKIGLQMLKSKHL